MIDVYEYAKEHDLVKYSAIPHLKELEGFLKNLKINIAVDIGTCRGISAAYLAQFANKVYTFDIIDWPEKYKVWDDLKVKDKIVFHLIKGRNIVDGTFKDFRGLHTFTGKEVDIKPIIDELNFDFAFIDGNHTYDDVKADFDIVKSCGRVLFHDIAGYYPEIDKFTKELGVTAVHKFIGYWGEEK